MPEQKLNIIKTYNGTEEECGCHICGIYYKKGKPINPQPKCNCGNIPFFDITENYVRFAISWPLIKVDSKNNWKTTTLAEIKANGKPKHVFSEQTKEPEIFKQ